MDLPEPIHEMLLSVLSPDERERAARYIRLIDQQRFVAARGTLRMILAHYLDRHSDMIRFRYTRYGKPYLPEVEEEHDLRFNLAHSHNRVLYAVSWKRDIGVDIERIKPMADLERLASASFSAAERAEFLALAPEDRLRGFFSCWTRKEAYLKALGVGLTVPLDAFDVSVHLNEPPTIRINRLDCNGLEQWSLHDIPSPEGYAGALAVQGRGVEIYARNWMHRRVSDE